MIGSPTQPAVEVHRSEVFSFVGKALSTHPAIGKKLVRLNCQLYDYHSSFAIEELTADFEDGSQLALLLKNLSPEALMPGARQTRPHFYYCPDREIAVYRDILAHTAIGTATCYGSEVDAR